MSVCGASTRESCKGLAPIGKQVEEKAINMFDVFGGKIVENQGYGEDRTDSLPRPSVPDLPRSPTLRHSCSCIETLLGERSDGPVRFRKLFSLSQQPPIDR